MKNILLFILIMCLIMTSCYISPITEYELVIIDNGQYSEDKTYHIVTISGPDGFDDFYYTLSTRATTVPTSDSTKYSPEQYQGTDSCTYKGILIKEGDTLKAVGYRKENGSSYATFVAEKNIPVSKWDISIEDNGPYSEDTTKHIVTITDSSWNGSIYYNFGKYDTPTSDSIWYIAEKYTGSDGKQYSGILVPEGSIIKAVSYKNINYTTYSSNIVEKDLDQWAISIVDNGPSLDDNNKRIVSIVDSVYSSNDIYYTLDGSIPTSSSAKYVPAEYTGTDSKTYVGILLPETTTVKTIAERTENGKVISSFISEVVTGINQWEITIIDHGESKDDDSKRIVSIVDDKWNGDIYYRTDGEEFYTWYSASDNYQGLVSYDNLRYSPSTYEGIDGNSYKGVLIAEATEVKAISCMAKNNKTQESYTAEIETGINSWMIMIVDNAQYSQDKTFRIVTISDSKWGGEIFYSYTTKQTDEFEKYNESEYLGSDNNTYKGVLVPEATTINAVSKYKNKGEVAFSDIAEDLLNRNIWPIDVVDKGQLHGDENTRIISIVDEERNGIIYYTLDGSSPTNESLLYTPSNFINKDSQSCSGILVSRDEVVNAISCQYINDIVVYSKIATIYKIGDIGPAGGLIFYDKGQRSDGWRYLEAGPNDLDSGYKFGDDDRLINTQSGIGTGKTNTETIARETPSDNSAAKVCFNYTCNGYNDWFLPSKDELSLMLSQLHKNGLGNFKDGHGYISSSEYNDKVMWVLFFVKEGRAPETVSKQYNFNVRPIRAF